MGVLFSGHTCVPTLAHEALFSAPKWPILALVAPKWSILASVAPKWSILAFVAPKWSILASVAPKWSILASVAQVVYSSFCCTKVHGLF